MSAGTSWAAIANGSKGVDKASDANFSSGVGVVSAPSPAPSVVAGKKQRACPLWGRKGRCRFGDRCKYLHDPEAKGVKVSRKQKILFL